MKFVRILVLLSFALVVTASTAQASFFHPASDWDRAVHAVTLGATIVALSASPIVIGGGLIWTVVGMTGVYPAVAIPLGLAAAVLGTMGFSKVAHLYDQFGEHGKHATCPQ